MKLAVIPNGQQAGTTLWMSATKGISHYFNNNGPLGFPAGRPEGKRQVCQFFIKSLNRPVLGHQSDNMKYKIISNYCGTLVSDDLYTKEEGDKKVAQLNQESVNEGFPEVTYSLIES